MDEALRARGGRVLAISVDAPERSRRVVEQDGLSFAILSDPAREVLGKYGLLHPSGAPDGGTIAIPAQLLVGQDGSVSWRHVSRSLQDRVDPDEALAAVRALK